MVQQVVYVATISATNSSIAYSHVDFLRKCAGPAMREARPPKENSAITKKTFALFLQLVRRCDANYTEMQLQLFFRKIMYNSVRRMNTSDTKRLSTVRTITARKKRKVTKNVEASCDSGGNDEEDESDGDASQATSNDGAVQDDGDDEDDEVGEKDRKPNESVETTSATNDIDVASVEVETTENTVANLSTQSKKTSTAGVMDTSASKVLKNECDFELSLFIKMCVLDIFCRNPNRNRERTCKRN